MKVELLKDIESPLFLSFVNLLVDFQDEVFKADTKIDLEALLAYNDIYVVVDKKEVIAFASFMHNDYFGFRKPTVFCNFFHIRTDKRTSRAGFLLYMQIGKICEHRQLPLECCYATTGSFNLGQRVKGKKVYDTYIYELDDVLEEFSRTKTKVKIKD